MNNREALEPNDPPILDDSSFSIDEISEGMVRIGGALHFLYRQGSKEALFSIHWNKAWGNHRPEYEFRAWLPFRDDLASEEVIQWRLRAAHRMASFMESDLRVHHLPGKVDLRDLKTFDGHRPNAIFWHYF